MTATKKAAMHERMRRHGENLLRIFPNATERDPVKLCKKLRRIEAEAHAFALRLCNGPEFDEGEADEIGDEIHDRAKRLLFGEPGFSAVRVMLNRDPRGYALKIPDADMAKFSLVLHRDWGGYGIIAPDLTEE